MNFLLGSASFWWIHGFKNMRQWTLHLFMGKKIAEKMIPLQLISAQKHSMHILGGYSFLFDPPGEYNLIPPPPTLGKGFQLREENSWKKEKEKGGKGRINKIKRRDIIILLY